MDNVYENSNCGTNISWSAIVAGALIAMGLSFLFNLFALSISLSAITKNDQGIEILAVSGFISLFVVGYVIWFIGGWVAGQLVRFYGAHPCNGILHGFLVWSLAVVIALLVLASQVANADPLGFSKLMVAKEKTSLLNSIPIEENNSQILNEPTQKAIHKIGLASLSTFFIFLAGVVGSCIGGYCGIKNVPEIKNSSGRSSFKKQ